ncbi:MAG TPA: hypothetical protein DCX03_05810 [Bacteroidales bacterium]|nr:hypothetical protein [Bacteroidales bacterium]
MPEEPKKKKKGVRLTARDLKIISWINSHRAATAEQVHKKFDLSLLSAKKRLYELKSFDYLIYEKIFHDKPGIYRAGAKGIAVTNDSLPTIKIRLGSYEHDTKLIDLAISLEEKTGAHWQTDRQIRHEKGLKGVGNKGHSPDGVLEFKNGNKVAVELELSLKGSKRIEKILKGYSRKEYKEVWYFVGSKSLSPKIIEAGIPFIKVFSFTDMTEIKAEEKPTEKTSGNVQTIDQQKAVKDFFQRK